MLDKPIKPVSKSVQVWRHVLFYDQKMINACAAVSGWSSAQWELSREDAKNYSHGDVCDVRKATGETAVS